MALFWAKTGVHTQTQPCFFNIILPKQLRPLPSQGFFFGGVLKRAVFGYVVTHRIKPHVFMYLLSGKRTGIFAQVFSGRRTYIRSRADGASHCGGADARAEGRAARAARGHPPGTRRSVHAISRLDAQLCRPTAAGQEAQAGLSELHGAVVADDRHKRAHACTAHPTAHRTSSRAHTHRALKGAPEPFRCRFVCRPPCSRAASAFVAPPQEERPLHERL